MRRTPTRMQSAATDDMLMIEPPPRSIMPGRNARIMRYMLSTSRVMLARHSSSPVVSTLP